MTSPAVIKEEIGGGGETLYFYFCFSNVVKIQARAMGGISAFSRPRAVQRELLFNVNS